MTEKLTSEIEIILLEIEEFYKKEAVDVDDKDEDSILISFPLGYFIYEKGLWGIMVDYATVITPSDYLTVMDLIINIPKKEIPLIVYAGFTSVFCDEGKYLGMIDQGDVFALMEDGLDEEESIDMLTDEMYEDNCKDCCDECEDEEDTEIKSDGETVH